MVTIHTRRLLSVFAAVLLAILCGRSAPAQDDASDDAAAEPQETIRIVHLHRPAHDLAQTLEHVFHGEETSLSIAMERETNVMILKGHERSVKRALELLQTLDRPKQTVSITVELAVVDAGGDSGQKLGDKLTLTTLADHTAKLQFGHQVSVPSGRVQHSGNRSIVVSRTQLETGTLLQATPRVTEEGIALDVMIEKSWLESVEADGDVENSVAVPPRVLTTVLDTTLLTKDGEGQTIRAQVEGVEDHSREVLITITASVNKRGSASARGSVGTRGSGPSTGRGSQSTTGRDSRTGRSRSRVQSGSGRTGQPSSERPSGGRPSAERSSSGRIPGAGIPGMADRFFERYDTNGDGHLNADELKAASMFVDLMKSRGINVKENIDREGITDVFHKMIEFSRAESGRSSSPNRSRQSYSRNRTGAGRGTSDSARGTSDAARGTDGRRRPEAEQPRKTGDETDTEDAGTEDSDTEESDSTEAASAAGSDAPAPSPADDE